MKTKLKFRSFVLSMALACAPAMSGSQSGFLTLVKQQTGNQGNRQANTTADSAFAIDDRVAPPKTYLRAPYQFMFQARGNSVPPLHWRVDKGTLPPGLTLDDNGTLHGEPRRAGEYHFAVSVTDSEKPQRSALKDFVITVVEAFTVAWKTPAHVSGNRIEGSIRVSNTTQEDIDLTFIAEAVAENGRATAIGYQHFVLRRATIDLEIPFGENMPPGGYVVNVDAIGEIAERNVIHRRRLQTPGPLQIVGEP